MLFLLGVAILAASLPTAAWASGPDVPTTAEEIEAFIRPAKVIRAQELSTGLTKPPRLTLSDGMTTHDAVFQAVDHRRSVFTPARGSREINFVDSWRYNVAAYRLARLVGLEAMMPVTVEYRYQGRSGSLSWWAESLMDEGRRLKEKVTPPDTETWNRDMYRMRFFSALVYDTDRNLGNVLVSPEWRVIMIDFTRAFRLHAKISPAGLERCDRQLLERLDALTADALKTAAGDYLTPQEAAAVLARRDLLVAHVRGLVASRGENKVLY